MPHQGTPSRSPTAEELEPWRHKTGPAKKIARGAAGWCGGIGVLLLLALTVAWLSGVVGIFTHGTILGYFGGTPQVLLVLFLSCAFYIVFLPLQGIVAVALRYASDRHHEPYFWGKLITVMLWIAALVTICYMAVYVPYVHDGLQGIARDYMH